MFINFFISSSFSYLMEKLCSGILCIRLISENWILSLCPSILALYSIDDLLLMRFSYTVIFHIIVSSYVNRLGSQRPSDLGRGYASPGGTGVLASPPGPRGWSTTIKTFSILRYCARRRDAWSGGARPLATNLGAHGAPRCI